MTLPELFQAVTGTFDSASKDEADIRLLIERIPKEQYDPFLTFYRSNLPKSRRSDLTLLADSVIRFNNALIESGDLDEIIEDLEEKLAGLIPTLLQHGFLSANQPRMTWAFIQNHYRLVADNTMLLLDFTKTEFEAIQKLKLDRAVRLIHRDTGEFAPYARALLHTPLLQALS